MRIGLLGGSFNPPHDGHQHISELTLKRAALDRVWWILTPGNPLKDHSDLAALNQRMEKCRELVTHPRIEITGFEAAMRFHYTERTLAYLLACRPRLDFVWIMGADSLAGFHRWQNWRRIADMVPIIVVDRPGSTQHCLSSPAAIALTRYRIEESDAALLAGRGAPAWTFLHGPRNELSSTKIRQSVTNG